MKHKTADIIVYAQEEVWIELVEHGGLGKKRNMPVFDAFHGHLTELVKSQVRIMNGDLVIIPETVLDIVINEPFKDNLPRRYTNWLVW